MNFIFEYGASLFDSVFCVYFLTKFNHKGFKNNPYWLPAILLIFGYTVISDLLLPGFNTLSTIIFLALYISYALIISQKKYIRAVISAVIFEVVLALLSSFIYFIISLIINDFDSALQGSENYVRYIFLILHKVSLFTVSTLILRLFKADTSLDIKNGLLTFGFSCTTIVGLAATMYISAVTVNEKVQLFSLIITFAFMVANVFLYILISQILKLQQEKYKVKILEDKLSFERARYNDSAAIWSNIRNIQHDIKQHLTIIKNQVDNKEYDDCQSYLQKLLPSVENIGSIIKSDNKIIDYMVNSKLSNLKDTQIIVSGSIGDISDIDELDLACLFGNILDNAIEATEKTEEKRIELLFLRQNSNRVIICKNTVNESVLKNNKQLKTTKKLQSTHGLGTSIVAKIVKKYHGIVEYFEEFDMFGVQIVLPVRKHDTNLAE